MASEKYQEGEWALQKAQQVQSEQQVWLQLVQQQQEQLRQQEQHMQQARLLPNPTPTPTAPSPASTLMAVSSSLGQWEQEHLSLSQQRLQLDRVRQDLPSGPMGLLSRAQGPAASGLSGK